VNSQRRVPRLEDGGRDHGPDSHHACEASTCGTRAQARFVRKTRAWRVSAVIETLPVARA